MKNTRNIETIVGFVIIFTLFTFLFFVKKEVQIDRSGYQVIAEFSKLDGISVGSDVRVSGIKVGSVTKQELNKETYDAITTLNINEDIKIPIDSRAKIETSGLLGKKYISIEIGAEDLTLQEGSKIIYTQSSISLEGLISKFLFQDKK